MLDVVYMKHLKDGRGLLGGMMGDGGVYNSWLMTETYTRRSVAIFMGGGMFYIGITRMIPSMFCSFLERMPD